MRAQLVVSGFPLRWAIIKTKLLAYFTRCERLRNDCPTFQIIEKRTRNLRVLILFCFMWLFNYYYRRWDKKWWTPAWLWGPCARRWEPSDVGRRCRCRPSPRPTGAVRTPRWWARRRPTRTATDTAASRGSTANRTRVCSITSSKISITWWEARPGSSSTSPSATSADAAPTTSSSSSPSSTWPKRRPTGCSAIWPTRRKNPSDATRKPHPSKIRYCVLTIPAHYQIKFNENITRSEVTA